MSLRLNNMQSWGKRQWRDHMKALLQKESPHSSAQIQQHLCEKLKTFLHTQQGIWAGYLPLLQEPDLSPVFKQVQHIEWAFPRMEADHLTFYISQNFIKGPFGVMEPSEDSRRLDLEELAGVLVPGLGFNKKGGRLGKGRGFYDKALAGFKGPKIGVCFSCQVLQEDFPVEAHDIRVDALITEDEIIQCN